MKYLAYLIVILPLACSDDSPGTRQDASDDLSNGDMTSDATDGGADSPAPDVVDDGTGPDSSQDGDTPLVSGPSGAIVWDFEDGSLQGFAAVRNDPVAGMGVNNVISEGTSGEGYGLEPLDFNGQRDNHHDLVLLRSPSFYLDASVDVRALTTGGVGDGSEPADSDALPQSTQSDGPHPLGIAIRRAADGAYVAVGNRSAEGDWSDLVIPSAELSEADQQLVFLDVIDAFGGDDWGWIVVDDIRVRGWSAEGECPSQPCADGVSCTNEPGRFPGFSCGECPQGFSGDGVTCTPVGGCDDDPCYEGVACTNRPGETPSFECGNCPSGREGDGATCTDINGCAGSPCYEGVECTDVAAPGTGFTCGSCPEGTTGDGITCTPLTCTPACEGWEECNVGSCEPRSCNGDGQCPGAYCFEGACRGDGSSCIERCAAVYPGTHTWTCGLGGGYCIISDCTNGGNCPGGDCVSDFNNSRGPSGGGAPDKFCVPAGSSPCGGSCAGLCSEASGNCSG